MSQAVSKESASKQRYLFTKLLLNANLNKLSKTLWNVFLDSVLLAFIIDFL